MNLSPASLPADPHAVNARVRAAIHATAATMPEHWRPLVASRSPGPAAAGSVCETSEPSLTIALLGATWEPYAHPAVMAGCTAFWTRDIVGTLGIVETDLLPETATLTLRDAHATGFVEAEVVGVQGDRTEGTCLIVGDEGGVEIVFTFHPGVPVRPSRVPAAGNAGRVVTPSEALALGLSRAKIVAAPR